MPVEVELNGLLPGRGPGLGAPGRGPGVGPPGWLGRAEPGVGAGRTCPVPARPPGLGTARGPGVWPPGPGTGPRSRWSPPAVWPGACSGWLNGTLGTPEVTARPPSPLGSGPAGPAGLAGVSVADSVTDRASCAAVGGTLGVSTLAAGAADGLAAEGLAACGLAAEGLAACGPAACGLAACGLAACGPAACGLAAAAAARPLAACLPCDCPAEVFAFAAWPANASLSLRTTGASIVDDADRTNSPISPSLAMTALLSTPNSLASSYTRTFATTLPASARAIRASQPDRSSLAPSGVNSCCSSPHAHRALITNLSLSLRPVLRRLFPISPAALVRSYVRTSRWSSKRPAPLPLSHTTSRSNGQGARTPQASARYLTSPPSASGPVTRSALGNARRRLACSKQSWLGCKYAPLPGLRAAGSATISPLTATTRSKSDLTARVLHPTHVRITDPDTARDEDRIAARLTAYRAGASAAPGTLSATLRPVSRRWLGWPACWPGWPACWSVPTWLSG